MAGGRRANSIAFTDDDCRPEPDWLRELASVSDGEAGRVVQGATRPDPLERDLLAAPHVRTLYIDPVGPYCQTCNILYPKALLEHLDGFDERAISGEDVGLSLRARASGATVVAAPAAIVNHAIESHTLPGILRQNLKWRHLAYLVKRHPEFRRELTMRRVLGYRPHARDACICGAFWYSEESPCVVARGSLCDEGTEAARHPPGCCGSSVHRASGAGGPTGSGSHRPVGRKHQTRDRGPLTEHPSRLRIAMMLHDFDAISSSEAASAVAELSAAMIGLGHEPVVVTTQSERTRRGSDQELQVRRVRRPPDGLFRARGFIRPLTQIPFAISALRAGRFDVIHAFSIIDAQAALMWRRFGGPPTIFTALVPPKRRAWLIVGLHSPRQPVLSREATRSSR